MKTLKLLLFAAALVTTFNHANAQKIEITDFDLSKFEILKNYVKVSNIKFKGKDAILIENGKREEGGIVYLKDFDFTNGTIECDIASETFSGIAFRVKSDATGECIYFRPFNSGTEKHENTVQYSLKGSKYGWQYLRENFPGKYESGATIQNNEWFHVRLEIKDTAVEVFVNNSKEPVLTVDDLKNGNSIGSVGLWTWNAYYANLIITQE